MTTTTTPQEYFSIEFRADSEFLDVSDFHDFHPADDFSDADFLDSMDFILQDEDGDDAMGEGADKFDEALEPLRMSKQGQLDAFQEDDASHLLSNLQGGAQQEETADDIIKRSEQKKFDQQPSACDLSMCSYSTAQTSSGYSHGLNAAPSSVFTSSNNVMQRTTPINAQLQTLAASMKRTEETRRHIIAQRQILSPEQKTMLGMATEQLKRSRLDFITGSGLLSSLM